MGILCIFNLQVILIVYLKCHYLSGVPNGLLVLIRLRVIWSGMAFLV